MKMAIKEHGLHLIDCGSATRQTMGLAYGFFIEAAPPPFYLRLFG